MNMALTTANHPHKTEPYRVTSEEVKQSLDWLEEEYKVDNTFLGSQRSEVKEIRFKVQDSPSIKDEDILRKFQEAQALDISNAPSNGKNTTSH